MEKTRILDHIIPDYTEKFLSGQFGPEEMPLLEAIGNTFKSSVDPSELKNVRLVACQHMLAPQLEMFRLFIELGIPANQITILPKIYSANSGIITELEQLGCTLIQSALQFHPKESFDAFHKDQCAQLAAFVITSVSPSTKLIILDDGGMLISAFAEELKRSKRKLNIRAVEQTASGKNILLLKELPFMVTSVASSIEKIQIETGYIIRHSMVRILEYFIENEISRAARILVLGKGPIGATIAEALQSENYNCSTYDILEGTFPFQMDTFDVIIGATGNNSVSTAMLPKLKSGVHLISIASSDREFPAVHIRNNSIRGEKVHDTFVYKTNCIHLANGGFPITFKGNQIECHPLEMDVTKMKLLEAVILQATGKAEISATVNELYTDKRVKSFMPLLYSWILMMIGLCIVAQLTITPGKPPLWFILPVYVVLMYGCIPGIWWIRYVKKLEVLSRA
jgi:hypothetical protein